jgi:hypothetical protein
MWPNQFSGTALRGVRRAWPSLCSPHQLGPRAVGQETITLNGIARTVSLMTALYGCGRYYPINTPLIEKMALASRRIGAELERRITEVNVTGPQFWCHYQYEVPGNRQFFKRETG